MIPLNWATPMHQKVANALGYGTHNRYLLQESKKYFDFTGDADISLDITPADMFKPIPNKFNVLFTMWESLDLPNNFIRGLDRADAIIVPCHFCKELFIKHGVTKPIYVCYLGVDQHKFQYYDRAQDKSKRFRFLWLGAPNPRKGYPFVLEAIKVFEQNPNIEIYLKTTVPKINYLQSIKNTIVNWKEIVFEDTEDAKKIRRSIGSIIRRIPQKALANKLRIYGKHKNVIMDTRLLPSEELVALYNSAHCFLLPTLGEGWGLTLCEAMATGCPSIATPVTGCADFFNEKVGYPLNYGIQIVKTREHWGGLPVHTYVPDTKHLIYTMIQVVKQYHLALEKGKKASELVRTKFTWEQSASRLKEIIEDVNANRKAFKRN